MKPPLHHLVHSATRSSNGLGQLDAREGKVSSPGQRPRAAFLNGSISRRSWQGASVDSACHRGVPSVVRRSRTWIPNMSQTFKPALWIPPFRRHRGMNAGVGAWFWFGFWPRARHSFAGRPFPVAALAAWFGEVLGVCRPPLITRQTLERRRSSGLGSVSRGVKAHGSPHSPRTAWRFSSRWPGAAPFCLSFLIPHSTMKRCRSRGAS